MKVKIIKARKKSFWYASEIGKVYEVKPYDDIDYYVALMPNHLIKIEDCKEVKPNTLEIYPYRGGFRYRKIAANGKILNHHYNTVAAAKKGAEAERKFWENFKVVYKG